MKIKSSALFASLLVVSIVFIWATSVMADIVTIKWNKSDKCYEFIVVNLPERIIVFPFFIPLPENGPIYGFHITLKPPWKIKSCSSSSNAWVVEEDEINVKWKTASKPIRWFRFKKHFRIRTFGAGRPKGIWETTGKDGEKLDVGEF